MAHYAMGDVPLELKPLTPFLQRAQELKEKDPTMSYWCSYYAVQQGVHLKPREKISRNYLVKLMQPLESAKDNPHSGVITDNEAACAYIEDFALRVFEAADNEDRRGAASRGTAKKFLAAANFLELLKVFEDGAANAAQPSSSKDGLDTTHPSAYSQHKQKIRYAKWKAADIAKAFREGRRPTPGPADAPASAQLSELLDPSLENGKISGTSSVELLSPSNLHPPIPGTAASRDSSVSPRNRDDKRLGSIENLQNRSVSPTKQITKPGDLTVNGRDAHRSTSPDVKLPTTPSSSGFSMISGLTSSSITSIGTLKGIGQSRSPSPRANSGPDPAKSGLSGPASVPSPLAPSIPAKPGHRDHSPGNSRLAKPDGEGLNGFVPPNRSSIISPGGWSTAATPGGLDDSVAKGNGVAHGSTFNPEYAAATGSTPTPSRTMDQSRPEGAQDPSTYPPNPYPISPEQVIPPARPTAPVAGQRVSPTNRTTEVEDNKDPHVSKIDRPVLPILATSRQDSWASNVATVGENAHVNRRLSWAEPRSASLAVDPQFGASNEAANEAEDEVGPLPEGEGRPTSKKVRWTPSVTGGMSSVASSSPRTSPQSEFSELPPESGTSENAYKPPKPFIPPSPYPTSMTIDKLPHGSPFIPGHPSSGRTPSPPSSGVPSMGPSSDPNGRPVAASAPPLTGYIPAPPPPLNGRPTNGVVPVTKSLPTTLPFRQISAAKRHSKFATSALEFDDLETARKELLAALAILNGEKTE